MSDAKAYKVRKGLNDAFLLSPDLKTGHEIEKARIALSGLPNTILAMVYDAIQNAGENS